MVFLLALCTEVIEEFTADEVCAVLTTIAAQNLVAKLAD